MKTVATLLLLLPFLPLLHAFAPHRSNIILSSTTHQHGPPSSSVVARRTTLSPLNLRIDNKRRKELGIADDEEEYDLDVALANNTDPLITKIIAGSFILAMIALLVTGLV